MKAIHISPQKQTLSLADWEESFNSENLFCLQHRLCLCYCHLKICPEIYYTSLLKQAYRIIFTQPFFSKLSLTTTTFNHSWSGDSQVPSIWFLITISWSRVTPLSSCPYASSWLVFAVRLLFGALWRQILFFHFVTNDRLTEPNGKKMSQKNSFYCSISLSSS